MTDVVQPEGVVSALGAPLDQRGGGGGGGGGAGRVVHMEGKWRIGVLEPTVILEKLECPAPSVLHEGQ